MTSKSETVCVFGAPRTCLSNQCSSGCDFFRMANKRQVPGLCRGTAERREGFGPKRRGRSGRSGGRIRVPGGDLAETCIRVARVWLHTQQAQADNTANRPNDVQRQSSKAINLRRWPALCGMVLFEIHLPETFFQETHVHVKLACSRFARVCPRETEVGPACPSCLASVPH